MYIAIDGDDFGRRIASCFIRNDEEALSIASAELQKAAARISNLLVSRGFKVVFSAADGVTAVTAEATHDFGSLFVAIQGLSPPELTFSAGVGTSLREAYIALLAAKSSGKNRLSIYAELHSANQA